MQEKYIEKLHLYEENQIKMQQENTLLKRRISNLQKEIKNRTLLMLQIFISFVVLCLGSILMILNSYILGIIFLFSSFSFVIIRIIVHFKNSIPKYENETEKIDKLQKLLQDIK